MFNASVEKKYGQAASKYTEAIDMHPTAVFYSNRAMAMIKLESYGVAIADANEAINLDPTYIKAYYRYARIRNSEGLTLEFRRGSANFALGKVKVGSLSTAYGID